MIGYLFVFAHVVAAYKFGTDNNDVGLWMAVASGGRDLAASRAGSAVGRVGRASSAP